MLDSPEGVCAGQVRPEYPATSVPFSKGVEAMRDIQARGMTRRRCDVLSPYRSVGRSSPVAGLPAKKSRSLYLELRRIRPVYPASRSELRGLPRRGLAR
jgi:hypothetical protein